MEEGAPVINLWDNLLAIGQRDADEPNEYYLCADWHCGPRPRRQRRFRCTLPCYEWSATCREVPDPQ